MEIQQLKNVVEAVLMVAGEPLSLERLVSLFQDEERPSLEEIREALTLLSQDYIDRGVEVKEVASGFTIQAKQALAPWVTKLWQERPPRNSRALLETLALIAYRQPITRGDIEEIRGVAVGSNIIKTLLENEWVRVVGQREVPGRPSLYATTRLFLDHFNLKSLEELPPLAELSDLDKINVEAMLTGIAEPTPESESESETEILEIKHEQTLAETTDNGT